MDRTMTPEEIRRFEEHRATRCWITALWETLFGDRWDKPMTWDDYLSFLLAWAVVVNAVLWSVGLVLWWVLR